MNQKIVSRIGCMLCVLMFFAKDGVLAQPLPAVPGGFAVEVYAVLDTRPGQISFDADDNLYVGNFNVPGGDDSPVHVFQIPPDTRMVTTFGPKVADPDAVIVDLHGSVGRSGSLLVGGAIFPTTPTLAGRITEISPDGSSATVLFSGGCLDNIQKLEFDNIGRLFAVNFNRQNVCLIAGGAVNQFIAPVGVNISFLAIDSDRNLYLSVSGTVRKYDSTGVLVEPSFASGDPMGFGPSGFFEGLILRRPGGILVGLNPETGVEKSLVVGTAASYIAFNSLGELFISELGNQRILRVFPTCTDNDGDGFGSPGNANCPGGARADCNDLDASTFPGAPELCDGRDNDCDGAVPSSEADGDGDGLRGCDNDCDDGNAAVRPGAAELPGNTVDENCDGSLGVCDPLRAWRNHGQFVRCVSHECEGLVAAGLVSEEQCDGLVSQAARSGVGKN